MNSLSLDWLLIGEVLREDFAAYQRGERFIQFVSDLADKDPKFWNVENLEEPALDAVWNFGDTFFYAVAHKMPGIRDKLDNELSIQQCEKLIESILDCVGRGIVPNSEPLMNFHGMTPVPPRKKGRRAV